MICCGDYGHVGLMELQVMLLAKGFQIRFQFVLNFLFHCRGVGHGGWEAEST